MSKMKLVLGVHCHQPVGNFDFVIEEVYAKAYRPFLETLARHPQIKFSIHLSGCLIDWLEDFHPEYLELIGQLVDRGQVEVLTGGYYEPILTAIPDWDRQGQIKKLSDFIKRRWGCRPKGLWLAERVWEPHLPETLARAGVDYVFVDDSHLAAAGLDEEGSFGYYLTEEQGRGVKVFPISERLRYLIPFRLPEETIVYLKRQAEAAGPEAGQRVATIVDDGEKFGGWPGTHKWVYEEQWLAKFLAALEQNADWLETVHPGKVAAAIEPRGRVYMPCASYMEMGEWSLPGRQAIDLKRLEKEVEARGEAARYKPYLRGGFWRNYLAKYPESNHLQKKALYVSQKIKTLKDHSGPAALPRLQAAENELWQSQCNCPYWHGIFGGLYLPHLRQANYRHLIRAEKLADEMAAGRPDWLKTEIIDLDVCGQPEIILSSSRLGLIIAPHYGGALYEIDIKARDLNILNTLARRFEAYHAEIASSAAQAGAAPASIHEQFVVKEAGLEKLLAYDRFRRVSLLDHLLPADCSLDDYAAGRCQPLAEVTAHPCQYEVKEHKDKVEVSLSRQAALRAPAEDASGPVIKIGKTITFHRDQDHWDAEYILENLSDQTVTFGWASEFNFSFQDNFWNSRGEVHGSRLELVNDQEKFKVGLSFSHPARIWRFPVETVAQSESGVERVYQSSVVAPFWRVKLPARGRWQVKIKQEHTCW